MAAILARTDSPIEGRTARWYASNTGKMRHEFSDLAARIAPQLAPGSRVLDLAPGPGYFSFELVKRGNFCITALDLSRDFVKLGAERAKAEGVKVTFCQGNAAAMPLPDASFDFLICRAAFKNFADPIRALHEMHRVLVPGGRAVIIDLDGNATPANMNAAVDRMGLTPFNRFLTKQIFRHTLVKRAYTRDQFEQMLAEVSFKDKRMEQDTDNIGFEIWLTR